VGSEKKAGVTGKITSKIDRKGGVCKKNQKNKVPETKNETSEVQGPFRNRTMRGKEGTGGACVAIQEAQEKSHRGTETHGMPTFIQHSGGGG